MHIRLATLTAIALSFSSGTSQAAVQIVTSPDAFLPDGVVDFEAGLPSSGPVVFSSSATLGDASVWTGSVTSSGSYGVVQSVSNGPLVATFSVPVKAVGFLFGNDDFGYTFDVVLSAYQGANLLGQVSLGVNRNDFADQFLGLISDIDITAVEIAYQRPQAEQLSVFVDDFRFAAAVPEPSTLSLGALGLALVAASVRKRGAAAGSDAANA